jgi:hypothetical protein
MTTPSTGPQNQLPEFKPRGMGKGDKIMMWILIFIVVLYGLGMINRAFPDKSVAKPQPRVTVTAPAHKATAPSEPMVYVVLNKSSGYIWWLDSNGSPFTKATAAKFALGHPTYQVETLKKG